MTTRRLISQADRELIAAVALLGKVVSARQLERWRQLGLIPQPTRQGQGRGLGTVSSYPEGTAEQVVELIEILSCDRRLDQALLTLFARGFPISEQALKSAIVRHLNKVREDMQAFATKADRWKESDLSESFYAVDETAVALANNSHLSRLGRTLLGRLRGSDEPPQSLLQSVQANILHALLEGKLLSNGKKPESEIMTASGASSWKTSIAWLASASKSVPTKELVMLIESANLSNLEECVSNATIEGLEETRDDLKLLVSFWACAYPVFSRMSGKRDPLGLRTFQGIDLEDEATLMKYVPVIEFLKANYMLREALVEHLKVCREQLPVFTSLNAFMDDLPKECWKLLAPGKEGELENLVKERPELIAQTTLWMENHPQHAAILNGET